MAQECWGQTPCLCNQLSDCMGVNRPTSNVVSREIHGGFAVENKTKAYISLLINCYPPLYERAEPDKLNRIQSI